MAVKFYNVYSSAFYKNTPRGTQPWPLSSFRASSPSQKKLTPSCHAHPSLCYLLGCSSPSCSHRCHPGPCDLSRIMWFCPVLPGFFHVLGCFQGSLMLWHEPVLPPWKHSGFLPGVGMRRGSLNLGQQKRASCLGSPHTHPERCPLGLLLTR